MENEKPDYFTPEEILAIVESLSDLSKVGINIGSHSGGDQLRTFFDKAKLWRVLSRIISAVYLNGLLEGLPFVEDKEGKKYKLVEMVEIETKEE